MKFILSTFQLIILTGICHCDIFSDDTVRKDNLGIAPQPRPDAPPYAPPSTIIPQPPEEVSTFQYPVEENDNLGGIINIGDEIKVRGNIKVANPDRKSESLITYEADQDGLRVKLSQETI